jgi:transcriptional regulator with GAF, ATPase, and Fis domain
MRCRASANDSPLFGKLYVGLRAWLIRSTDLSALERTTIAKVLQESRENKTRAARRLGLSRTQHHLRVRKYRLEEAATV